MFTKRLGIVRLGKALAYGYGHGSFIFLPAFVKRTIVRIWNHSACFFYGHTGDYCIAPGEVYPACTSCCREIKNNIDWETVIDLRIK